MLNELLNLWHDASQGHLLSLVTDSTDYRSYGVSIFYEVLVKETWIYSEKHHNRLPLGAGIWYNIPIQCFENILSWQECVGPMSMHLSNILKRSVSFIMCTFHLNVNIINSFEEACFSTMTWLGNLAVIIYVHSRPWAISKYMEDNGPRPPWLVRRVLQNWKVGGLEWTFWCWIKMAVSVWSHGLDFWIYTHVQKYIHIDGWYGNKYR